MKIKTKMKVSSISGVLIDALEYIKRFNNQIFVIKLGGEVMMNEKVLDSIAQDLVLLNYVGIKPVVIHGGGKEISDTMKRLGKEPKFIKGLRVTDKETMDITQMVLIGKISTEIVAKINLHGGNSVSGIGLSGKSGRLILAEKTGEDLGLVGKIKSINPDIIELLLKSNYIPVISPVGLDEEKGDSLNINADTAAAEIAIALWASKLILMTSVDGVFDKEGKLIEKLKVREIDRLINSGTAKEGMIPKLKSSKQALLNGVKRAHIIKGSDHTLLEEIFTSSGIGTMIEG